MPTDDIQIRWAERSEDLSRAVELRKQVFCEEQGVPVSEELDGRDREAEHIVALSPDREQIIGTLRLLIDGPRAKVGRVAVAHDWRRRGIASQMLTLALARARRHGCTQARLAAQLDAVALYEQAGFSVESERFEEAGIPHVWMGRALPKLPPRRRETCSDQLS
jgi:putative N-acetyltransferase (TIGR04045 family)